MTRISPKTKREVIRRQDGMCAVCDRPATDIAHLRALGMGRNRGKDDHPLNQPDNLLALCRNCHVLQEAKRRKRHHDWVRGEGDYQGE